MKEQFIQSDRSTLALGDEISAMGSQLQAAATIASIAIALYAVVINIEIPLPPVILGGIGVCGAACILSTTMLLTHMLDKEGKLGEILKPGPYGLLYLGILVLGFVYLLLLFPHWADWISRLFTRPAP